MRAGWCWVMLICRPNLRMTAQGQQRPPIPANSTRSHYRQEQNTAVTRDPPNAAATSPHAAEQPLQVHDTGRHANCRQLAVAEWVPGAARRTADA